MRGPTHRLCEAAIGAIQIGFRPTTTSRITDPPSMAGALQFTDGIGLKNDDEQT
jgi:hypothetical protein